MRRGRFVLPYILAIAAAAALCVFAFGRLNNARDARDAALAVREELSGQLEIRLEQTAGFERELELARAERADRLELLEYWQALHVELEGYINEAS